MVIGADGARSKVAKAKVQGGETINYVIAYHKIIEATGPCVGYDPVRCDVILAQKFFMRDHKSVFTVLGAVQNAYYRRYDWRERFVSLCHDVDVQN